MKHYAWVLEVRPGYEQEYKKRHDEIWPEMVEMLQESGLRNYNIFRHGLTLFGYFETDDLKKSIKHIVASDVNKKWGKYMSDILKVDIDTLASVEVIEQAFGHVRLHESIKASYAIQLVHENVNINGILSKIDFDCNF